MHQYPAHSRACAHGGGAVEEAKQMRRNIHFQCNEKAVYVASKTCATLRSVAEQTRHARRYM